MTITRLPLSNWFTQENVLWDIIASSVNDDIVIRLQIIAITIKLFENIRYGSSTDCFHLGVVEGIIVKVPQHRVAQEKGADWIKIPNRIWLDLILGNNSISFAWTNTFQYFKFTAKNGIFFQKGVVGLFHFDLLFLHRVLCCGESTYGCIQLSDDSRKISANATSQNTCFWWSAEEIHTQEVGSFWQLKQLHVGSPLNIKHGCPLHFFALDFFWSLPLLKIVNESFPNVHALQQIFNI